MSSLTNIQDPRPSRAERLARAPVVVEVDHVSKTFEIPDHRVDSVRERVTHPFKRYEHRHLNALRDITFDIRQGEFFGIVGRNGSGKSTLLKIMGSIYRADAGKVRMAGRLAPFIELGVGFNPELSSRENVTLNGVLMGLSRREAARRLDAVLEFAELTDFVDLKLKNYSSGMMVRLAFAVMVEADADIMLIDEVLAVGDAAFSQKCISVFEQMREAGRTIVLVTHDMATVQRFCDRAMLIHDSQIQYLGDPEETALRYYRRNFAQPQHQPLGAGPAPDVNARVIDAWLESPKGMRVQNVEQGQPIFFNCLFEARLELEHPVFSFQFFDSQGNEIFGFTKFVEDETEEDRLEAGDQVLVSGEVENRFRPGTYHVGAWILRNRTQGDLALHSFRLLEFVVFGTEPGPGSLAVDDDVKASVIRRGEAQ